MNPTFDPFDPMAQRPPGFVPSNDPSLFGTGGGGTGGGGTGGTGTGGTGTGGTGTGGAGGSPPSAANAPKGAAPPPTYAQQYAKYYQGGNIGQSQNFAKASQPGWHPEGQPENTYNQTYDQWRADMAQRYPWMENTSVVWGGGPGGYLPVDYQYQNADYYSGPGIYGPRQQAHNGRWFSPITYRAPWEDLYASERWTQNFDPQGAGFIDTSGGNPDKTYPGQGTLGGQY